MWAFKGSSRASSSTSPLVAGGRDRKLPPREAPSCYVEVYEQHDLRQGQLVTVPQLLQCWTGGLLKRERVCNWLSLELVREVTDVYIQHWSLAADGLAVKLLLFDEARAKQEGSPFRNGARVVVCCCGEPLLIDAAARIQAMCPAHPVCRALTLGLLDARNGSARSRECASRRAEIWTIVEQLQSVVQWTEEAQKRCSGRGKDNVECLVLVYHLLLGLTLGTDSLERLDNAREQLRQEYTAIRNALCGLNLHVSRIFDRLQPGVVKEEPGRPEAEEDGMCNDMLAVAGRMLYGHSEILSALFGGCLPLKRIDSLRSQVSCTCISSRPSRPLDRGGPLEGEADSLKEQALALQGASGGDGPLPSRVPGAARASAERRLKEAGLATEDPAKPNLAQSLQAGAQMDQLWRSTHHL